MRKQIEYLRKLVTQLPSKLIAQKTNDLNDYTRSVLRSNYRQNLTSAGRPTGIHTPNKSDNAH